MIGRKLQFWKTNGCGRGERESRYSSVESELTNDITKGVLYTRDIHLASGILITTL